MDRKLRHASLSRLYEAAVNADVSGELLDGYGDGQKITDWMKSLKKFGAGEPANEPPLWAVANAFKAFQFERPSVVRRFAKEVLATLVYDSFSQPLPAGVRQRDVPSRQTLYRAEGLQLDLKVQLTGDDKGLIIGQVVSEKSDLGVDDLEIALSHEGSVIRASTTNSWGEFLFEDLPKGEYELQVQLGETILRLPNVPLGQD